MTSEQRVIKAKVSLLIQQPWFGQLACYLNQKATDKINAAAINERGDLYYNPKFVEKCSDEELKGLICHEILHLAFQHPFRLQNRDKRLFNIAADLKVNNELSRMNGIALPKGGLEVKYGTWSYGEVKIKDIDNKTTEQIYKELDKQAPKISNFILDLTKASKKEKGIKEVPASELPELAKEWQSRVNIVNMQQKGNAPAGLLRELKSLEYPELPWTQIVRQRLRAMSRKKSWQTPNKRYLPWYFPGMVKNKGLSAAIAIDTSGSMSSQQLTKALSEIWGLSRSFKDIKFYLITCDIKIGSVMEVNSKNKKKIKEIRMIGGGGTDFRPVFRLIKERYQNMIDCCIYFTDLYGNFPSKKPPYQVYWVTDSNLKVPFGRIIHLKS